MQWNIAEFLLNKTAETGALNAPQSEFLIMIPFLSVISVFDESNICISIVVLML